MKSQFWQKRIVCGPPESVPSPPSGTWPSPSQGRHWTSLSQTGKQSSSLEGVLSHKAGGLKSPFCPPFHDICIHLHCTSVRPGSSFEISCRLSVALRQENEATLKEALFIFFPHSRFYSEWGLIACSLLYIEEPQLSALKQHKLTWNIGTHILQGLVFGSHLVRMMSPMAKTPLPASTGQSSTAWKAGHCHCEWEPKNFVLHLQSLGAGTHQDDFILSWITFSLILPRWVNIFYLLGEYYLI